MPFTGSFIGRTSCTQAEFYRSARDQATNTFAEQALQVYGFTAKHGKTYEFHTYENCGHAFFAVDREQYRVHAALDGWKRVLAWFGKYLR